MKDMQAIQEFLKSIFADLLSFVESHGVSVIARTGFSENDKFAFRAYLSFSLLPGDELVVLSVDCKYIGDSLILESDIAATSGEIITEGPTTQLGRPGSVEFNSQSSIWADKFKAFIERSRQKVVERLESSTV